MGDPSRHETLGREDELKLLGFLATLAGLLGVVVAVSQFQLGSTSSTTVRAYFAVSLVVYMFLSAVTYLGTLQGKDIRQWNLAVLGYFAALLGLVVGLAAATLYPEPYQFVGFWVTAFLVSWILYLPLFRWHRGLSWIGESR
ncbi:MAG TPA: hypothetical protein VJP06_02530 [Thermoplasmata archaeon]|nr:hypothetical protein [Thermoplasmata archaeon]